MWEIQGVSLSIVVQGAVQGREPGGRMEYILADGGRVVPPTSHGYFHIQYAHSSFVARATAGPVPQLSEEVRP